MHMHKVGERRSRTTLDLASRKNMNKSLVHWRNYRSGC